MSNSGPFSTVSSRGHFETRVAREVAKVKPHLVDEMCATHEELSERQDTDANLKVMMDAARSLLTLRKEDVADKTLADAKANPAVALLEQVKKLCPEADMPVIEPPEGEGETVKPVSGLARPSHPPHSAPVSGDQGNPIPLDESPSPPSRDLQQQPRGARQPPQAQAQESLRAGSPVPPPSQRP